MSQHGHEHAALQADAWRCIAEQFARILLGPSTLPGNLLAKYLMYLIHIFKYKYFVYIFYICIYIIYKYMLYIHMYL